MAVLGHLRRLSSDSMRSLLGIAKKTHRSYLRTFENGGQAALFAPNNQLRVPFVDS